MSDSANNLIKINEQIDATEPELHALLARQVIEPTAEGSLSGTYATVKDVIVTQGVETTAGAKMLKGWMPPYDATVVTRLKSAGATILGKNNCDAWAHGTSTENSDFGPTKNPWDTERVPGGSSGGSAAAVAAGYGDFSLGSDTGGSIRQPAAFCGVTGLKPTYGRVSRYGLIAMASSFDTIGPLARDVATAARVLEVIAGRDSRDATTVPGQQFRAAAVTQAFDNPDRPLTGLRVGIPREYFADGLDPLVEQPVRAAIAQLESLGATLVELSLPSTTYAVACYYVLVPAEVSSNLARFDGIRFGHSVRRTSGDESRITNHIELVKRNRGEGFGAEAKRRIILGTFVLSAGYVDAYYKKASRVRTLLRNEFTEAFSQVDVIATPVTPGLPFKLGEHADDPLALYLQDIYTVPANLVGIPGVSVPCGFVRPADGQRELPVGLQLLGPMFGEETLLRTAHAYQQATNWHTRRPEW